MALGTCRECGKQVSSEAASCPHCGVSQPVPRKPNVARGRLILLGLVIIGVLAIIGRFNAPSGDRPGDGEKQANPYDARAAEEKPAGAGLAKAIAPKDDAREADFQRAILLVRAVKARMNDPSSLDVFEAHASQTAVAIGYRGKNAFGALIMNYAVATKDGKATKSGSKQDVAMLWNKHIANRSLTDLTSSVQGAKLLGAY